jgi:hypothetical protein
MKLESHFLEPKHEWESELLKQHHLTVETEEQKSMFLVRYSAPVGLMALSMGDLRKTLREHVEHMVENPRYPVQTTMGDATNVPLLILEEVRQYWKVTDVSSHFRSEAVAFADDHTRTPWFAAHSCCTRSITSWALL